ncbi:MAG: hypothetical protein HF311_11550 [Ignavibacteria bacterium]|jgi:hypothetical protein|nr:hypothetical protein [Ignavibacteria bacterium]MCU7517840.1 hypothetical protein [Ignavibacteria bacterium]
MGRLNPRPGFHLEFRAYVTDKNGKRHYASYYGHKAFPIWVPDEEKETSEEDESSVE